MSMSAQHKIYVKLNGEWTAEARELLEKALEWWTEFYEYEELEFLGDLEILPSEDKYGPFFGLTYNYLKGCLEKAINGVNKEELTARESFDQSVQQSLLDVMQAKKLQITFYEYIGYLEGEDCEEEGGEDCWDSEPSLYKLSSDGKKFVISG